MKNTLIFKSRNNNFYLYNRKIKLLIHIHPLINYFFKNNIKEINDLLINEQFLVKYNKITILKEFELYNFFLKNKIIENISIKFKKYNYSPYEIQNQLSKIRCIIFEVTDKCNLDCYYCCNGQLYNNNESKINGRIPFKYIENIFEYLKNNNNFNSNTLKEIYIGFYGGEPLIDSI